MTAPRQDSSPVEAFEGDPLPEERSLSAPRLRRGARTPDGTDRETVMALIRDIPNFAKLLGRLITDPRVSRVDKGILAATVAYLAWPMDLIPDFIPFLGQVDDLYLLALALDRLLNNAGVDVLLDHWDGDVGSLETAIAALDRAGSFLPDRVRSLLGQRLG
jgi:uncharacterized membrane protein YkvA (DUF1232 family)